MLVRQVWDLTFLGGIISQQSPCPSGSLGNVPGTREEVFKGRRHHYYTDTLFPASVTPKKKNCLNALCSGVLPPCRFCLLGWARGAAYCGSRIELRASHSSEVSRASPWWFPCVKLVVTAAFTTCCFWCLWSRALLHFSFLSYVFSSWLACWCGLPFMISWDIDVAPFLLDIKPGEHWVPSVLLGQIQLGFRFDGLKAGSPRFAFSMVFTFKTFLTF